LGLDGAAVAGLENLDPHPVPLVHPYAIMYGVKDDRLATAFLDGWQSIPPPPPDVVGFEYTVPNPDDDQGQA